MSTLTGYFCPSRVRHPGRWAIVALVLVLVVVGCTRGGSFPLRTAAGRPPNVLLITVDTLRADHLGTYGYDKPTSPTIDALAARGVRCDMALTSAPETGPGVAAILTGLHQHHNRVRFNREVLPTRVTTLAEQMSGAGYTTAAFVSNGNVNAQRGFDQGFGHFDEFRERGVNALKVDARGVDRVLAWLATRPAEPWFIWIHLLDPHGPYVPTDLAWTEPFATAYAGLGPREPVPTSKSNFGLRVLPVYQAFAGITDLGTYIRRYDGEIRETDAQIGRLLAGLDASELTPSTLIVLTADHGESLTEHDEYLQHGWFLYNTTLRIPLILAWPGVVPGGRVLAEQIRSVDIVPTIEEIVGITRPQDAALDGTSFAGRLVGDEAPAVRTTYAIGPRGNHQFAVLEDGWKLIYTPANRPIDPTSRDKFPTKLPERYELYDLGRDPGEVRDLVASEPARVRALGEKVAAFRREFQLSGFGW